MDDRLKEGERLLFIGGKEGRRGLTKGSTWRREKRGDFAVHRRAGPALSFPVGRQKTEKKNQLDKKTFGSFPVLPCLFPLLP